MTPEKQAPPHNFSLGLSPRPFHAIALFPKLFSEKCERIFDKNEEICDKNLYLSIISGIVLVV
jgi:hypothetical protein